MNAIRIRKKIDSDTVHIPELGPLIGHTVDILIEDQSSSVDFTQGVMPGTGDWKGLFQAAKALHDTYDYDAVADQDACDFRDAAERLK